MQTTLEIIDGEMDIQLPVIIEEQEQPLTLEEETNILSNLTVELQKLKDTSNLLAHRLNTLQSLLDQERFELSSYELKVKPSARAGKVRELLVAIGVQEEGLLMGDFLKALNKWLVSQGHVDLNDLQILMTPLLSSAFYKPAALKKMPYPLLLLALDKMFL
jgi:hypothetical protein